MAIFGHDGQRRDVSSPLGLLGRTVVFIAVLTSATGCIPSSSNYPYVGPDPGVDDAHTPDAPSDASRDADAGDPDLTADALDACFSQTDDELCDGKCGTVTTQDLCDRPREVDCGGCTGGTVCNEQTNRCCVPEDDESFCDSYQAECGILSGLDNCGMPRVETQCPYTCDVPDDCQGTSCGECVRESDADFCRRHNYECGDLNATDNCGDPYQVMPCGVCENGSACTNGVCICPGGTTESNCADQMDNDCDGLVDCMDEDCDGQRCGVDLDLRRCRNDACGL